MDIQSTQMMSINMIGQTLPQNKEGGEARLIGKTIDKMNETKSGEMNSSYQFQKDVLSSAAADHTAVGLSEKGSVLNIIA
jgi:hypothetical protein